MNILFIFYSPILPYNGGVERVTSILGNELSKRNYNIYYLCSNINYQLDPKIKYNENQFFIKKNKFKPDEQIIQLIDKFKIEIVIYQGFSKTGAKILSKISSKVKIISVNHSQPFATYKKEKQVLSSWSTTSYIGKIFRAIGIKFPSIPRLYYTSQISHILKNLINVSDKYCLLSAHYIKRIETIQKNIDTTKIIAINNPNTFDPKDININKYQQKSNIILYVGRIENLSKNVSDFIKVWSNLYNKLPNWEAVVVGSGSDLNLIENEAKALNLERIRFENKQPDVIQYYNRAKFLCLTSNYEGWPMVLTEAMTFGCIPISYNNFEAVYDIIDDRTNGYIISPNPQLMAERILTTINTNGLCEKLYEAAINKVKQFSVTEIVNKWEETFTDIMKK